MSRPGTVEEERLRNCEARLCAITEQFDEHYEARLQILEAAASCVGGFSTRDYFRAFEIASLFPSRQLSTHASELLSAIETTGIPVPLALSALGREPIEHPQRRNTGSYHTDVRLARRLVEFALPAATEKSRVLDPACGSGMLLTALTLAICGSDRKKARTWLLKSVHAADQSINALRAAAACLACFTNDVRLLKNMRERWIVQDSLLADPITWKQLAPRGFDVIIANPPWEKVKLTRHEFLQETGDRRHYGADYSELDETLLKSRVKTIKSYAAQLVARYDRLSAEPDLYMAFLQLFLEITRPGGRISALVPAGLIRSKRTEPLRELLVEKSATLVISVIENRARFFSIDTRFKFLAIGCKVLSRTSPKRSPLLLLHETGDERGVKEYGRARLPLLALRTTRADLSVPEVRSDQEWRLFRDMTSRGISWHSDQEEPWCPDIVREIDMTKGRQYFADVAKVGYVPVIEGRMIHQHRFGAKTYISGTGRRAIWRNNPLGLSETAPQFWIDPENLSPSVRHRLFLTRAGFCDITGQTNERTMMAAIIPPNVVCGNKVPTITFPRDPSLQRLLLWVAIVNSLPFDWLMRRIVTTTVNYFLLLSLPLPPISKETIPGRRLIDAATQLRRLDTAPQSFEHMWMAAELRARIDVTVAMAYGLCAGDIEIMLEDFPLLDRAQPALPNENRSTVTADFLLLQARQQMGGKLEEFSRRISHAKSLGAAPYVPSAVGTDHAEAEMIDYA